MEQKTLRLQVYLSRNGICSRRKAMELVQEGQVRVNGRVVREPSTPINPERDKVTLGQKSVEEKSYEYILLNKPMGFVTTKKDRYAKKIVTELLPFGYRHLVPVGRLDKDTEGLLLLTNDGDVAYKMTHPKFGVDKKYFVQITGRLALSDKQKLENGIYLEGKKTVRAKISISNISTQQTELTFIIHEGRKRQIRRMFSKVGHKVIYLKRLTQGPLSLGRLRVGKWKELTKKEINEIRNIGI